MLLQRYNLKVELLVGAEGLRRATNWRILSFSARYSEAGGAP